MDHMKLLKTTFFKKNVQKTIVNAIMVLVGPYGTINVMEMSLCYVEEP